MGGGCNSGSYRPLWGGGGRGVFWPKQNNVSAVERVGMNLLGDSREAGLSTSLILNIGKDVWNCVMFTSNQLPLFFLPCFLLFLTQQSSQSVGAVDPLSHPVRHQDEKVLAESWDGVYEGKNLNMQFYWHWHLHHNFSGYFCDSIWVFSLWRGHRQLPPKCLYVKYFNLKHNTKTFKKLTTIYFSKKTYESTWHIFWY